MSLAAGHRLGPYTIVEPLGAGGMGEVYRARDTKLNRDVAIKILPPAYADDADRVARFSREAQTLAAMNHPNIAQIYGFEELDGVHALIMELVDGATLADRLASGPLPVGDALRVARQIAEAIEAAHAQGIVHRDLKPGNIAIRGDDRVKVLDFGLARMLGPADAAAPTITAALSDPGVMLGTIAYMSPEQTLGHPADARSDIWAFGCVLFEMLTGARAFGGASIPEMFVAIANGDPDWAKVPASSVRVQPLLARCLRKDPRQRLQAIGDARIQLDELMSGSTSTLNGGRVARSPRRSWWGAAALVAVAIAAALMTWLLTPRSRQAPLPSGRFEIVPPSPFTPAIQGTDRDIAVAPDGSFLVYRAGSQAQLVVRRLDRLDTVPIAAVTNARGPFISPDGRWIGFVENNTSLKKVAVGGGTPMTLAVLPGSPRGATWIDDASIVVATNATGLLRVPASGGEPTVLTTPDRAQGELAHLHPSALPGGRLILFTIAAARPENSQVAVLDLETRRTSRLLRGGSDARYLASGHLLYGTGGGTLSAVRFDPARATVVGNAVPIIEGVAASSNGALNAAVTDAGVLIYRRGGVGDSKPRSLAWVDRQGHETVVPAPERSYASLRVSPDANHVALEIRDPDPNIWLWDLTRRTLVPLTFNGGMAPVWTPNGSRVVFTSPGAAGSPNLYSRAADGTGTDTRLTTSANVQVPASVTPDGTSIVSVERRPQTASDLVRVSLQANADGTHATEAVIETLFTEQNGEVSPDGRFLAYESNESGRFEIWVQPYPRLNGKWRVSIDGGTRPAWTRNGQELVYLDATNHLAIVPVETNGSTLRYGTPRTLASVAYTATNIAWRTYDVSPDGQRFLVIKEPAQSVQDENFVVVLNFFEELKQKVR